MSAKEATEKLLDLKVAVDNHDHKGERCKKGATIKVSKQQKEWLETEWAKQAKKKE